MTYVAWDIEICPLRPDDLSDPQRDRRESEIDRLRSNNPDGTDEYLSRQAGSFHPHLG